MSNLGWHEEDDEMPWESDKFNALDELAYKAGIDKAPDKGPNYDKMFLERVEKNEFTSSRDGQLARTALLAEHMDYNELKQGKFVSEKTNQTTSQGKYIGHACGSEVKGNFIGNLDDDQRNILDQRIQDASDDDDDLFRDDDDEFERQLEQIKLQRIKELKQQATINGQSISTLHGSNDGTLHKHDAHAVDQLISSANRKLSVANGVKEIIPEEYETEVKIPSKTMTVFLLVYKANNRASEILLSCLNTLAKRQKSVKMCVILYSSALLHVPEHHCPILMCYQKDQVVANFAKLDHFRGSSTTALDIEWKLAEAGIIETTLLEDPRESAMFD